MLAVCIQAATAYQRADLSARLEATGRRLADPLFHTLVVGEFKQGKSSLINALLGTDVCPVDDDVATAVPTMLRWAETPTAVITRNPPADTTAAALSTSEIVPIDQVPSYVSEAGNPGNERQVESVEIGLPSDLLRSGLVLVDTPGVGGLGSTHSAITIGVLPMADAVLFVSDAAQEFSGPELEFLHTARSLCPNVGCVVTKVDFYPAWRKIIELDEEHLVDAGLSLPVLPVSSVLQRLAIQEADIELGAESGFVELHRYLATEIIEKREDLIVRAATNDMLSVVGQLESQFATEQQALADPARAQSLVDGLRAAADQSDRLRSQAARWQVTLNDGFADLLTDVDHDLRSRLRGLTRDADEAIDATDPAESWEEFEPWLYRAAADHIVGNYTLLQTRAGEVAGRVSELFSIDGHEVASQLDIPNPAEVLQTVAASADVELESGSGLGTGMNALRSSYGGVLMFGMLGQMVGLALINPIGDRGGSVVRWQGLPRREEPRTRAAAQSGEERTSQVHRRARVPGGQGQPRHDSPRPAPAPRSVLGAALKSSIDRRPARCRTRSKQYKSTSRPASGAWPTSRQSWPASAAFALRCWPLCPALAGCDVTTSVTARRGARPAPRSGAGVRRHRARGVARGGARSSRRTAAGRDRRQGESWEVHAAQRAGGRRARTD